MGRINVMLANAKVTINEAALRSRHGSTWGRLDSCIPAAIATLYRKQNKHKQITQHAQTHKTNVAVGSPPPIA